VSNLLQRRTLQQVPSDPIDAELLLDLVSHLIVVCENSDVDLRLFGPVLQRFIGGIQNGLKGTGETLVHLFLNSSENPENSDS
jgi:hypothetical protein